MLFLKNKTVVVLTEPHATSKTNDSLLHFPQSKWRFLYFILIWYQLWVVFFCFCFCCCFCFVFVCFFFLICFQPSSLLVVDKLTFIPISLFLWQPTVVVNLWGVLVYCVMYNDEDCFKVYLKTLFFFFFFHDSHLMGS